MPDFVEELEGLGRGVWAATFAANGAALIRAVAKDVTQVGVRRKNAADDGAATLGGGTLKLQTASVAAPVLTNDDHWNDTSDATMLALEIGISYLVGFRSPMRLSLSGSTSPDFVVEVR